ncbi:putative adhesin [Isoptericola jiangsuensis]|uniref:Putative adhesin n=1 Tax=Isoptericola jiangsuensis TaxID=548579 RepID=A0A2A9EW11_9MICO|nr:DUF4097 family beta strand repeat-containing protein [Isoptericola jiangsuensis]PFG42339.1 putative adhesin [Isoptericola jiangsuensis]
MPTFPAPRPVPVTVDVPFARLHVVASDRDDVVVTVLPSDPSRSGSVRAAEEVRVERTGDGVAVTYPGSWKQWVLPFAAGTADVTVELPTGSEVRGRTGSLHVEGALHAVEMSLSAGDARLGVVDRLTLAVGAGSVHVGRAVTANVKASAGSVHVDEVAGEVAVKASNGTTTVGTVSGALTVQGAHGDITVRRVRGAVTARSAHSSIRVDALESGSVALTTSFGSIDVGVPEGTAAYLDLATEHGTVRNQLTPTDGPVADEATAEIHASTGYGDVVVRRPHA